MNEQKHLINAINDDVIFKEYFTSLISLILDLCYTL